MDTLLYNVPGSALPDVSAWCRLILDIDTISSTLSSSDQSISSSPRGSSSSGAVLGIPQCLYSRQAGTPISANKATPPADVIVIVFSSQNSSIKIMCFINVIAVYVLQINLPFVHYLHDTQTGWKSVNEQKLHDPPPSLACGKWCWPPPLSRKITNNVW